MSFGHAFWIDRGGTFTDCIAIDLQTGQTRLEKRLSSDRAPLECIRALLGLGPEDPIPPVDVRMGTTVATNALLTRSGRRAVLVTQRGLGDVLEIGTQARPSVFGLDIQKPELLYQEVIEIGARVGADGSVVEPLDEAAVAAELRSALQRGLSSVAVVLLHSTAHPEHERRVGAIARSLGFLQVSLSHEVDGEIGLVARGDTTTVDAYLTPLLTDYVRGLQAELPGSRIRIMQSSGGLASAERFRGAGAILSGPAGGAVAVAAIADALGLGAAIGFDMGGTSTDVCRYGGELERRHEHEISGVRVRTPMIAVHTVAAGGGSLCRFEGHRLTVGPDSAGAKPGPLCYGDAAARALTLTDVDLLLGRLSDERFPFPLDRARAQGALDALTERLAADATLHPRLGSAEVAAGFFEVATTLMTDAIRRVSVARGHDVRDHALIVFGGAGGQHATAIARRLGVRRVVFHPWAGVLSAYGIGIAQATVDRSADAGRRAPEDPELERRFQQLEEESRALLLGEAEGPVQVQRFIDLRYQGSDGALTIPHHPDPAELRQSFEQTHRRELGWARQGHPIEATTLRVLASAGGGSQIRPSAPARRAPPAPSSQRRMWTDQGRFELAPLYLREDLPAGHRLEGPALILDQTSTIALDPGFSLEVDDSGVLIATDQGAQERARGDTSLDPVRLEIYSHLFMSIAEEMGTVLRRSALSTNIKERLDFSCALFDPEGALVANAPHIPVHLGAMGETVRAIVAAHPLMKPGDVFASNDPALGGSHLPDITVVTPVFDAGGVRQFFTACRGHHADVGGITPGSMPPFSTSLAEEGVVLSLLRIVSAGRIDDEALSAAFQAGPHPARDFAQNRADLMAQTAANRAGAARLEALIESEGGPVVAAYMRHVQDNAAARVEEAIAELSPGRRRFSDALDDGSPIVVEVTIDGRRMAIDFSGSSAEHPGNLNAPRAVVMAAVIYVLRTLVAADIPLNQGCLAPVEVIIPPRSILDPSPGRAVAAGNVETSQRVVDVLLGALGLAAASQGTMNNLTLGNARFGYYETIAGGAGAGPTFRGAHAIHTHMTNTRITDAEVLELRFPLRLLRFEVRRGSGGRGRQPGGDGVIRSIEALTRLEASILSERRARAPFGLAGGEPGRPGQNWHDDQEVPAKTSFVLEPGQRVTIATPGGGGYGDKDR